MPTPNFTDRLISAVTNEFDNRADYGDGEDDVVLADTVYEYSIYGKNIWIPPGVTAVMLTGFGLYARDTILIDGTLQPEYLSRVGGEVFGNGTDNDPAASTAGAGGATASHTGGKGHLALSAASLLPIRTRDAFLALMRSINMDSYPGGGGGGGSNGNATSGQGGGPASFLGLRAPTIDVSKGLIDARGQAGTAGSSDDSITAVWEDLHAYSLNDLITDGTHTYRVTIAGTSDAAPPTFPTNGTTVVDATVTWKDEGLTGRSGGGGGGRGGLVATFCRLYLGQAPVLSGGTGGAGFGGGDPGGTGFDGLWLNYIDR